MICEHPKVVILNTRFTFESYWKILKYIFPGPIQGILIKFTQSSHCAIHIFPSSLEQFSCAAMVQSYCLESPPGENCTSFLTFHKVFLILAASNVGEFYSISCVT